MLAQLTASVHAGLYEAWRFAFEASDTPGASPKPEYVCTAAVAQRIVDLRMPSTTVLLEHNVQHLAASSLLLPMWPRLHPKPRIPPRKQSSRGDRERVDIAIFDRSAGIAIVPRACVELKISASMGGLREDLDRNRKLMELARPGRVNQLDAALLGLMVVNTGAVGTAQGTAEVDRIESRYVALAERYVSSAYAIEVSVKQASSPPDDLDDEFVHNVSVVIAFARHGGQPGSRFFSDNPAGQVIAKRT